MPWWAWIKRLFTHPYGTCRADGCDRPRQRWSSWCGACWAERLCEASEEIARREFEREVRVHAEALRRVLQEHASGGDS